MAQKPHRFLIERVSGYADEAGAYVRRRRMRSKPFVRLWYADGSIRSPDPDSASGRRLLAAATRLLEADAE